LIKAILKQAGHINGLDRFAVVIESPHERTEVSLRSKAIEQLADSRPGDIGKLAASQLELSNNYYNSVLKQAGRSFFAAVVAATTGVIFSLLAVAILEFRHGGSGSTLSAIGGGLVETIAGLNFWLFGKTSAQLDAFHVRLDRLQTFLLANSICESITEEARDLVRADLVKMMAGSRASSRSSSTGSRANKRSESSDQKPGEEK
jgi:hypothetical protein